MKFFLRVTFFAAFFLCVYAEGMHAHAEKANDPHEISERERLSLARSFVDTLRARLNILNQHLSPQQKHEKGRSILPDGEEVLLQPRFSGSFRVNDVIYGFSQDNKIFVSMSDFASVLDLALNVDAQSETISGWYLREDRVVDLSVAQNQIVTPAGQFALDNNVITKDGDVWVSIDALSLWFDFDADLKLSEQEIVLKADVPFPEQARANRKNVSISKSHRPEPQLPLGGVTPQDIDTPFVDVSTATTYRKGGSQNTGTRTSNATVRTVGDFAKGTLTTQSRFTNREQLASVRATYKQDSLDAELLGPLKAKRVEVGDVFTVRTPLGGRASQELGVRFTNTDERRNFSQPNTAIYGNAIPGWDVELYRGTRLLGVQQIGEDGVYQFPDVTLFQDDNRFKLVFYGPQGEIREENVFVPYDRALLSRGEGIYDVSVSLDRENVYTGAERRVDGVDDGSLKAAALYEKPLPGGATVLASARTYQENEERNTVGTIGFSDTIAQTLVNASVGVDDEAEVSAQINARRDIGLHEVSAGLVWRGAGFDEERNSVNVSLGNVIEEEETVGNMSASITAEGPIPYFENIKPRYSAVSRFGWNEDGENSFDNLLGLNFGYKRLSFNTNLRHRSYSSDRDDQVTNSTSAQMVYGKNRLRVNTGYEIAPDTQLRSVLASYRRYLSPKLEVSADVAKRLDSELTEYQMALDWQAGFMRITPSIRYNTNDDFFAGLNTRFGIIKDPSLNKYKMLDQTVTSFGMLSVFVYWDKDGDGAFNGEDEALEDVVVRAPQNGIRQVTSEDGVALFPRLIKLRLTDVYIDEESLQDPLWIPGFQGVSILPRDGHIAQLDFPVHMSGELDGSVYVKSVPLPEDQRPEGYVEPRPIPLRGVELSLYNDKGEVEQTTRTESDGFYYFSRIPPGRYLLIVSENSVRDKRLIRPEPQKIEIGYEGTVIYGNDVYLDAGEGDVPSDVFEADGLASYKALHPHVDFDEEYDLVLNLGAYNSRLLMSVVWYKIKSRFDGVLDGATLFVPPAESYASAETGQHVLRVGLNGSVTDAYGKCRSLMARDQYCKVEIYPYIIKQANNSVFK